MNEVLMSQIEWPKIGRYIGTVVDKSISGEGLSAYVPTHNNKLFINMKNQSQDRRVYGDEIVLDKDRISHTRRIMECMKTPLFANI